MRRVTLSTIVIAVLSAPSGVWAQQETDPRGKAAAVAAVRFMVEHHLAERKSIGVSGLAPAQVEELSTGDRRVRPFVWQSECGATVAVVARARAACGLRRTDTHVEVLRIGNETGDKRRVLVIAYMPTDGLVRSDDGLRFLELEIELTELNGRWASPRIVGGRVP